MNRPVLASRPILVVWALPLPFPGISALLVAVEETIVVRNVVSKRLGFKRYRGITRRVVLPDWLPSSPVRLGLPVFARRITPSVKSTHRSIPPRSERTWRMRARGRGLLVPGAERWPFSGSEPRVPRVNPHPPRGVCPDKRPSQAGLLPLWPRFDAGSVGAHRPCHGRARERGQHGSPGAFGAMSADVRWPRACAGHPNDLTLYSQPAEGRDSRQEWSRLNRNCTICHSCRYGASDSAVPRSPGQRPEMAGIPMVSSIPRCLVALPPSLFPPMKPLAGSAAGGAGRSLRSIDAPYAYRGLCARSFPKRRATPYRDLLSRLYGPAAALPAARAAESLTMSSWNPCSMRSRMSSGPAVMPHGTRWARHAARTLWMAASTASASSP